MREIDSKPVAFGLELIELDDRVEARAVLEVDGDSYRSTAAAMRTGKAASPIAVHLAVARVLRSVETAVMETIHERIDRYVANE